MPDANPKQPLHMVCWNEHHSDPTEVWPPDHKCGLTEEEEEYEPVVKWRKPPPYVCVDCKKGNCVNCIDVLRVVINLPEMCHCKRKNHDGEPANEQIADPTTGSVFGPGLEVTQDGDIVRSVPPAVEP